MRRRAAGEWVYLFAEYLIAAIAEALVAAAGWCLRKIYRWFKQRRDNEKE